MLSLLTHRISTPVGEVPVIAILAVALSVALTIIAGFWPRYRRAQQRRRIRNLPPPPVKNESEPDLRLPRR
ncbi:MAG: hypothetical protein A3G75_09400 [Verrucomicrobia bacterium RIFCSPLOWO2_12_FULL_64_8]|nr:MAG: hypothetical protein A3G75_09400 [Verrucomicrobia bacterium RIFCSPLOWO2_12_FULL_64_8]